MTLIIDNRRRREKSTTTPGVRPSIPPSEDHTDGFWSDTDIHEREIFINIPDGIVYTRIGTDIIEINTPDGIVSGLTLANGSDAVHYDVAQGFVKINGILLDHSAAADEVLITDGDSTDPRIDLVTVNSANAIVVVAGTPAVNPVAPSLPADSVLVDVIVVPANHVAGSTAFLTFGLDNYNERFNRFKNWIPLRSYEKDMIVIRNQEWYRALKTHVSSTDFTTDLQGSSFWETLGVPTGVEDEWQSSVISVETDPTVPPASTASFGDRFLIGAGATGIWSGRDGQIADMRDVNFRYTTPTDGMSVKVDDDDGKIYQQEGAYSAGVFAWIIDVFGGGDLLSTNNLSDVANATTSYNNIKQQGTTSFVGAWESATVAEINTGTDGTRVVTALGLAGSQIQTDVTANNSKISNATHTGDVTGSVSLTIGAKKVTIAMLSDGTDGELITWDSSGVATTVSVGTAGQVLTSNGAGNAPSFQAGGGIYSGNGSHAVLCPFAE